MSPEAIPPSVNFHITSRCEMRCRHCFAGFGDVTDNQICPELSTAQAERVIRALPCHVEKITFSGGEPTLYEGLPILLKESKRSNLITMIVSNGFRLVSDEIYLRGIARDADWVALSIDTIDPAHQLVIGRTAGVRTISGEQYLLGIERLKANGVRIKINTVVSRFNYTEDISEFINIIAPERWKIMQAMEVVGQNDNNADSFRISDSEFRSYVDRHKATVSQDVTIVAEGIDDMRGTYAMITPDGRFFDSARGKHRYSRPILEVGIKQAWSEISFSREGYQDRGAIYDWSKK
jgi:radical S-adenosyl methionine domain-containing protein 2